MKAPMAAGNNRVWLSVGSLLREYLVHVPESYDGRRKVPVVLMFHGSGGSLDETANVTGWIQKSDEVGFLAVFANGFPNAEGMRVWNDGRYADDTRVDDVAFTRALLDDLALRFRVDAKRVYAVGFSNGAGLAYRLGAELGDRIAAIAPVAGRLNVAPEKLGRAVPMIAIIGTEDGGFRGGAGRTSPARWATLLGCGEPGDTVRRGRYASVTFQGCPEDAGAVSWTIDGWEHYWPGGPINRGVEMWAETKIWEFFAKHPLKKGKRE